MTDSLNVKLADIEKSASTFYYRLILNGQTIDIFSNDKKIYYGEITNSIKQYDEVKVENDFRTIATQLFTKKIEIDSSLANVIAQQIIKSGQLYIPTDSLIKSWKKWYLHCGSLIFEMKNDDKYIKQSFHCPWSQPDSVEFKDIILANYNLINQELKLDSIYNVFMSELPKGKTYSRNGYGMTYIMTTNQEVAWEKDKPRREYLKSIKDTIDNYLNTNLRILQSSIDSTKYSCFDSYYLTFGKNGKLKKIWTHPSKMKISDGLSWYIEDRREIRHCYRRIKKIFRKVDLTKFNLTQEVHRTFYFDLGNGWTVIDNTIY